MLEAQTFKPNLGSLFRPRSVALVGISDRCNSYGLSLETTARSAGFAGDIFGVNPRLAGRDDMTFAHVSDLPDRVEHVVISVANQAVQQAVEDALEAGAKALTIFAECPDNSLRARIMDATKRTGVLVCGPNSMGLHDFHSGLRITPFDVPMERKPGGVGLISQSGSVLGAFVNNGRRFQFSQAVSTGSETVTTAADYLDWMVKQPETRCVGMFLESIREPEAFMLALEHAAAREIPVVITKVGKSELGAELALSHTGALVGNDDVFRAVVRRFGGHLTESIDEMAALLAVFSQGRRAIAQGIASIHDSGGERELIADLAESQGLTFAKLQPSTTEAVQDALEDGIHAQNPLDAWGTGAGAELTFEKATVAMMNDPAVGLGLYVLNWRDDYNLHQMHERALTAAFSQTDKPLVAVSNFSLSRSDDLADRLGDVGIPVIGGLQNAVLAGKALLQRVPVPSRRVDVSSASPAAHRGLELAKSGWISEEDGYALFSAYGIAVPQHVAVSSSEQVGKIAQTLSLPVVCKTAMPGIVHKTDVGGIVLNLGSPDDVVEAYHAMHTRLGPKVLIAEMLPKGSEWSLGAIIDPDFGPLVRIAPGGTLVELLDESALLMAPFSPSEAKNAIQSMRASALLLGYRGAPVLALDALADAAAALSRMAWDLRGDLSEIEINPIIVTETAATAADAVVHAQKNQ